MIRNHLFYPYCERTSTYLQRDWVERMGLDVPSLREVAVGIEKYLQTGRDGSFFSDQTLIWMAAQAMVAAGQEHAAAQIIERMWDQGLGPIGVQCLRYRDEESNEPWRLFGTGMVRLSVCGFEDGPLWIVDLARVHVRAGHFFELSWVPALYRLMRSVTRLWGYCAGRGILAIRGVRPLAECLYGQSRRAADGAGQMVKFCREVASRVAAENGANLPRVITLESHLARARLRSRCRGGAGLQRGQSVVGA